MTDLSRLKLTPAELEKRHAAFTSSNHISAAPGRPGAGASPLPNNDSARRRRRAASSCGPRPAERAEPRPRCATACDGQAPRAWRSAGSSSEDGAPRVRRRARAYTGLDGDARARCTDSEDSLTDEGGWARGRRAAAPVRQPGATASASPGAARGARPDGLRSPGSAHEPAQPGCDHADPPTEAQAGCAAVPGLRQQAAEEGAPEQPLLATASPAAAAPAAAEAGLGAGEVRGGGGPGAHGRPGAPAALGPASSAAPAHAGAELDACVRELRARLERAEAAAAAASTVAGLRREVRALQAERAALQARPASTAARARRTRRCGRSRAAWSGAGCCGCWQAG